MFHRRRQHPALNSIRRDRRRLRPRLMYREPRVVLTAPTVSVAAASSVSLYSATLNGSVNANGTATNVSFQYSTNSSFTPSVESTIVGGQNDPQAVAADAAGDVFIANTDNNAVEEVLTNGTTKTIGSGFEQPEGMAVDAAGDVFVTNYGDNDVQEVLPNGTIKTIVSLTDPQGLAVDAAGDVQGQREPRDDYADFDACALDC